MSGHGPICMSCGGIVDADGLAPMDLEGDETEQAEGAERMSEAAGMSSGGFAAAVRGYAGGGEVYTPMTEQEIASAKRPEFNQDTPAQRDAFAREWYAKKKRELEGQRRSDSRNRTDAGTR